MKELTAETVRDLLIYEPETGAFRWRKSRRNAKEGWPAGRMEARGYVQLSIFNRLYYAHRVAWLYMTGKWPTAIVDHINGVKNDNRWSNLREATGAVNQHNLKHATMRNRLGYLGVSPPQGNRRRYKATINVNGRSIHLGYHDTPQLAHEAYLAAKRRLHEGCTI